MKPLRHYLLATASSVALLGSAAAQPPAPPVMSWAGPYAGLNLGVAWNHPEFSDLGNAGTGFAFPVGANDPFWSPSQAGFTFGGQAGYNWQTSNIVYGIEGDLNWVDSKANTTIISPLHAPITITASSNLDWMATIRGRLGLTFSQVLVYGTGGVAFAHFSDAWGFTFAGGNAFTSDKTRTGWTAGGGVEYMLARNWTVRAEALYADFGSNTFTVVDPPGNNGPYTTSFRHTVSTARAALNWKW